MIQQLILSTLIACQPKTEMETPAPISETKQAENKTEQIQKEDAPKEDSTMTTNPEEDVATKSTIMIVKDLSSPKQNDEASKFYSSSVKLSNINYPRDAFTDEQFCNSICANAHASGPMRLTSIENCQLELLENWESLRKDFSWDQAETNNPVVGTVQCNADVSYIRKGRAALSTTKGSETADDLGGYFARAAQEEMTAIFAFQEMFQNLQAFGAPKRLLDDCEKAISDEKRHLIMMSNMAKRHGCTSATIKLPKQNKASLFELAKHNAIAGCIEETWSALVAEYQSKHTKHYSKLFAILAEDEIFHAQLSWDIHSWLMSKLSNNERDEITALMKEHLRQAPPQEQSHIDLGEISMTLQKELWAEFSTRIQTEQLQPAA